MSARPPIRRLLSLLWFATAAAVVAVAVLLSVARLALPVMEDYREQLAAGIGERIGLPVRIEALDATWRAQGPALRLRGVRVLGPDGAAVVAVDDLQMVFGLWRSLAGGMPVVRAVAMDGVRLGVRRGRDGRWRLAGVPEQTVAVDVLAAVLTEGRFTVTDARLRWHDAAFPGGSAMFAGEDLEIVNRGRRHRFQGRLTVPGLLDGPLRVVGDMEGRPRRDPDAGWRGAFHVVGEGVRLGDWPWGLPPELRVTGRADASLWLDVRDGVITDLRGRVGARGLGVGLGEAVEPALESVAADWRWRRDAHGWRLDLARLAVTRAGETWHDGAVRLALRGDAPGGPRTLRMSLQAIDARLLRAVLADSPLLSRRQRAALSGLDPRGRLERAELRLLTRPGGAPALAFEVRFQGLGLDPWGRVPGLRGLTGSASGTLAGGRVHLDSPRAVFTRPGLFRAPLRAGVNGSLTWRRLDDRLRLAADQVAVANADIRARARLRVDLFPRAAPWLDLQVDFSDGATDGVRRYLPVGIMPPKVVGWLDRALGPGAIPAGRMLYHGRGGEFPFDAGRGTFQVGFRVADTRLDYHAGWPPVTGLTADVLFRNRGMWIVGRAGRLGASEVSAVHAAIPDLQRARLHLTGRTRGALADAVAFLRDSPLADGYGDALGPLEVQAGEAAVDVDLMLPLDSPAPAEVRGAADITGGAVRLPQWDVTATALTGPLRFTQAGLRDAELRGRWRERAVTVAIAGGEATRVSVSGPLGLAALTAQRAGLGARAAGDTGPWRLTLVLPPAARPGPVRVRLTGDLTPMVVDLPPPLGKAAGEAARVNLETTVRGGELAPVHVRYGERLDARLVLARREGVLMPVRGAVVLGGAAAGAAEGPGLRLGGRVERLALKAWRTVLAGAGNGGPLPLERVELAVGELGLLGRAFSDVTLAAQRDAQGWEVRLDSRRLAGVVQWLPDGPGARLRALLHRLEIEPLAADADAGDLPAPGDVPPLDLEVERLVFGGRHLGHLSLRATPAVNRLEVEDFRVDGPAMSLAASGEWTEAPAGQRSWFRLTARAETLAGLLTPFGYSAHVLGGKTEAQLDARWDGPPTAFDLERVVGALDLSIGEGRLVDVEPGAGRVFGLLSVYALPRRLALDFSDLFRKGLSFDRITGQFSLRGGDAYTDDLVLEGPSARVEVSGRTGLADRTYDQQVTVIPNVRATLPVAGALAGGPGVGAILLLADRLLPGPMKALTGFTRHHYRLTGSWDDPVLERVDRPDDGAARPATGAPRAQP